MGFFSYLCKVCGLSVLNSTSVHGELLALSNVVALDWRSNKYEGYYDGYGNVGINDLLHEGREQGADVMFDTFVYTKEEFTANQERNRDNHSYHKNVGITDVDKHIAKYDQERIPALWHKFCYDGTIVYTKGSERCEFQGHFFQDEEFKATMAKNVVFMQNYINSLDDCPEDRDAHCNTCTCNEEAVTK
jgi:hypothetical protein